VVALRVKGLTLGSRRTASQLHHALVGASGMLCGLRVRIPADTPKEIAELTRRRNVYLCRMMGYDEPLLLSSELASVLAADFASLGAMYRLFCTAVERQELTF